LQQRFQSSRFSLHCSFTLMLDDTFYAYFLILFISTLKNLILLPIHACLAAKPDFLVWILAS
jgi:hypothetical protein